MDIYQLVKGWQFFLAPFHTKITYLLAVGMV